MDDLTYTYANSGKSNQLIAVADNGLGTFLTGVEQFVDGSSLATEYTYDNSGNLNEDKNKGVSSIQYNHLNKPTLVNKGIYQVSYHYGVYVKCHKMLSCCKANSYDKQRIVSRPSQ